MTVCPNCGSETEDDSIFCEECGYQIKSNSNKQSNSSANENKSTFSKKIRFVKQRK